MCGDRVRLRGRLSLRHLFVTNDFPPKLGGIESYLSNLCRGFAPEDVVVMAPTREGQQDVDDCLPYEVIRLSGSYLRATARVERAILDAVRSGGVDVVHFLAALPLGRLGAGLRKEAGVRYTVVAHGTGEILVPARIPVAKQALRKVLTQADVVFPVSEFTKAKVDELARAEARTVLLPPSVDTERFSLERSGAAIRTELGLGGRFVVLFLSRLVKRKGADILIRAVAATQGTVAIVAGAGPERPALERLARELELDDRVLFTGTVPDDRLPELYAASDAFCMPCTERYGGLDTEGFGVVYLEAAASGLPCIAGRCGGSAEAVEHGVTGIVIDDPSTREVAIALLQLRDDLALRARLGGAGRSRVESEFAPHVAAARLEGALASVSG